MSTIPELKQALRSWVDKEFVFANDQDYISISVPFIDNDHDLIDLYVKDLGDSKLLLTDLGDTLTKLQFFAGIDLKDPESLTFTIYHGMLQVFGVENKGDCLQITSSVANFARDLNNLIQCILSLEDLEYLQEAKNFNGQKLRKELDDAASDKEFRGADEVFKDLRKGHDQK